MEEGYQSSSEIKERYHREYDYLNFHICVCDFYFGCEKLFSHFGVAIFKFSYLSIAFEMKRNLYFGIRSGWLGGSLWCWGYMLFCFRNPHSPSNQLHDLGNFTNLPHAHFPRLLTGDNTTFYSELWGTDESPKGVFLYPEEFLTQFYFLLVKEQVTRWISGKCNLCLSCHAFKYYISSSVIFFIIIPITHPLRIFFVCVSGSILFSNFTFKKYNADCTPPL